MGVKIYIQKKDLPTKYQKYNLIATKDGVSDTVYLLGKKYVLKIFDNQNTQTIANEQYLLKLIKNLKTTQIKDIFKIKNKQAIIYTQIKGKSIINPQKIHIKQIAKFLRQFHHLTQNKTISNKRLFTKKQLNKLIKKTSSKKLLKHWKQLNIKLNNDGIIHGDLFCDNVKFKNDILSGVFDFSEANNSDFIFELAVVTISWCFDKIKLNKKKTKLLLKTYGLKIIFKLFKEYIKYALVYYATTRYLDNRDYKILLKRLDNL